VPPRWCWTSASISSPDAALRRAAARRLHLSQPRTLPGRCLDCDIAIPRCAGEVAPLHDVRRPPVRWRVEDHQQRHDLRPVFDNQITASIGALAIAPSDENVVWVGTGDASNVRVTMPGNGVYKSADAGKTWQHVGLAETHRIARTRDPSDQGPTSCTWRRLGRLWSPNEERGVYKTSDGGRTWTRLLYNQRHDGRHRPR